MIKKIFLLIKLIIQDIKNGKYEKSEKKYGVNGIVGKYGSGKSQYMALIANKYKKEGSIIYANFGLENSINFDNYEYIYNLCQKTHEHKVILIDECQMFAPEGGNIDMHLRLLISQCRKLNTLIYWSSQDFTRVNKNIRLLSNRIYEIKSHFLGRLETIKDFNAQQYEFYYQAQSESGKIKARIYRPKFEIITDEIRDLYDTYEIIK